MSEPVWLDGILVSKEFKKKHDEYKERWLMAQLKDISVEYWEQKITPLKIMGYRLGNTSSCYGIPVDECFWTKENEFIYLNDWHPCTRVDQSMELLFNVTRHASIKKYGLSRFDVWMPSEPEGHTYLSRADTLPKAINQAVACAHGYEIVWEGE